MPVGVFAYGTTTCFTRESMTRRTRSLRPEHPHTGQVRQMAFHEVCSRRRPVHYERIQMCRGLGRFSNFEDLVRTHTAPAPIVSTNSRGELRSDGQGADEAFASTRRGAVVLGEIARG